jgi:hypothetical protein
MASREGSRRGEPVYGQAVDAARDVRPGVPREHAPVPFAAVQGRPMARQTAGRSALEADAARRDTATFGTVAPPRGLSGLVRRAAHRLPEHRTARWVLLMGADRLDVLEHRLRGGFVLVAALLAAAVGYVAVSRLVRE